MPQICRVVGLPEASDDQPSDMGAAWARSIIKEQIKLASTDRENRGPSTSLPALTVTLKDDGASLIESAQEHARYNPSDPDSQYPACYRIPPTTLHGLPEQEQIARARCFAIGSLIYTVMVGKPPFSDLDYDDDDDDDDDDEVQWNFERGIYPAEVKGFPFEIAMEVLGLWSLDFAREFVQQQSPPPTGTFERLVMHAREHPYSTGAAALGFLAFSAATLVVPVLGVAGFSAIGPVAGSAAAAWQASIGLVQAGSLFSLCQSVAMGGAATAIGVAQVAGASAMAVSILQGGQSDEKKVQKAWTLFTEKVRKVEV